MSKHKTRFKTSKFPIFLVIFGIVLIISGIFTLVNSVSIIGGVILIILGVYLTFSHNGIDINLTEKKFRYFESHFGIKSGNWKHFKYYPNLSLLTINQKQTAYSYTNVENTTKFISYKIYLLNQKHTEKILLTEFRKKSDAERTINELADELNLKIEVYSPDFS